MKFVLVTNARCPKAGPGWYRQITDVAELDKSNGVYTRWYWNAFWEDPHTEAALLKEDVIACVRFPMNILPKRNSAMALALLRHGEVWVNRNGGWCFPSEGLQVIDEVQQDVWPTSETSEFQYVYVGRWPLGNHYYLQSWPKPIQFSDEKFNTPEEAVAEAKRHVPENRIKFRDKMHGRFIYNREGD